MCWIKPPAMGADITSYKLKCFNPQDGGGVAVEGEGGSAWSLTLNVGDTTQQRVEGLMAGAAYNFQVAAINSLGVGPFGGLSRVARTHSTIPDTVAR